MAKQPRASRAVEPVQEKERGRGRPAFEPTGEQRNMVETLSGLGIPQEQICLLIINPTTGKPIDLKTLHKHFRDELDTGLAKANSTIAQSLFKHATGKGPGAVAANIFLAKVRLGWKEAQTVDLNHGLQDGVKKLLEEVDGRTRGLPKGA